MKQIKKICIFSGSILVLIGYADSSIKKLIKDVDQNIEVCSCKELYEYLLDIIPKTSKYKKIAVNKLNELYN